MTLAEVAHVPHDHIPVLTIVYFIAFIGFGGASALLLVMMRNAAKAYDERSTVKLAGAALVTGLVAAGGLILFVSAVGFIGRVMIGLAFAVTLVVVGSNIARGQRGYAP